MYSLTLYRYALNIKKLPYKTVWVEYPDIEALYHKLGISAAIHRRDGSPYYTLPIIHDPSTDTLIPDSLKIVQYLDKTYPETPTLIPEGTHALHAAFNNGAIWSVQGPLFKLSVAAVCNMLNPRSQDYFRPSREKDLGMKLEEVCGEQEWEDAEAGLGRLKGWLDANGEGKNTLVLGDRISFADCQIACVLKWVEVALGKDSEGWKRICSWHGGLWKTILDNFDQYGYVDL